MLVPGDILEEKYRVIRKLGEGGMGAVYVAEHMFLEKKVALKVLHPQYASSENSIKRFYREAKAASASGHPGIVEIFDIGKAEEGAPYLVMELLSGYTLERVLQTSRGRFAWDAAAELALEMLEILQAVHEKNVVHRDLKPENIFINHRLDGRSQVKILDFGISKFSDDKDPTSTRLTKMGSVVGTVLYMSPEQGLGEDDVDLRTDLWSVGVILYEMLTGRLPFMEKKPMKALQKILNDEPRTPRSIRSDIPEALERVVLKAMEKDRENRYSDASEFMTDLVLALDRPRPSDMPPPVGTELPDVSDDPEVEIKLPEVDASKLVSGEFPLLDPKLKISKTASMPLPREILGDRMDSPVSEAELQDERSDEESDDEGTPDDAGDGKNKTYVNIYPLKEEDDDEDITEVTPMFQFAIPNEDQEPSALEAYIASLKDQADSSASVIIERQRGKPGGGANRKGVSLEPALPVKTEERFATYDLDETPISEEESSRLKKGWKITFSDDGMVVKPASKISKEEGSREDLEVSKSSPGWFVKVVKQVKAVMGKGESETRSDDPGQLDMDENLQQEEQ